MQLRIAALLGAVLLVIGFGPVAGAHEEAEAVQGPLEVEARPALVDVGEAVVVEAEYEPDEEAAEGEDEVETDEHEGVETDEHEGVETDEHENVETDEHADVDGDGHAGVDTDEHAGADTDEHAGVDAEQDPAADSDAAPPATVAFTVDFGDGSGAQPMQVTEADAEDGEAKAEAEHAYTVAGTYTVTVTATPDQGTAVATSVTVHVGTGTARLDGPSRFDTATRISREDFPRDGDASAVLLARADGFADALASASLAVLEDAPVLLTPTAEVPDGVLDEIARALGPTGDVFLLGGDAAIAPSVAERLTAMGYQVHRIAGTDRVDTAVQIAQFLVAAGVDVDEVVLASAGAFADALSGAAFAAAAEAPVLLTASDVLDPRVREFLAGLDATATEVIVAGGTAAVSDAVAGEVAAMGFKVERLAGENRFDTSAEIAEALFADAKVIVVATGLNFPDALAGAAQAGRRGAPILLVADTLPDSIRTYLATHADEIERVYFLGGDAAVPAAVAEEVQALVGLD